jgi:hypothetical protein
MKKILEQIKAILEAQRTAANGLMDTAEEAVKTHLKAVVDQINDTLSLLPPLEQIPAATDFSYLLASLSRGYERLNELNSALQMKLGDVSKRLGEATTELNGFRTNKDKTILIVDADRAKDEAVKAAKDSMLPEIVATRKSAVVLCGFPVPSDEILGLPAADYQARLTGMQANLKDAGKKGLALAGKGKTFLEKNAWMAKTEFNSALETIADLTAGATPITEKNIHPLLGNDNPATPPAAEPVEDKTFVC